MKNIRNFEIHLLDKKGMKYTIKISPDYQNITSAACAARAQNGK